MFTNIYSTETKNKNSVLPDENGYYHLIYKITNTINGKIYIGKHSTKNPCDDYMGSGKAVQAAIKKYGIDNFTKEIIYYCSSEKEAYQKEAEIVNESFVNSKNTYNLISGGIGWSSSDVRGEKNCMYGVHRFGEHNPFFNKKHTAETRIKMSKNHADFKGANHPQYGKHRSEETKRRISEHHADVSGKNNPYYGKGYLQAGGKNPRAKPVLKIDNNNNIILEYGCMKECCTYENISSDLLKEIIENHNTHNGYYFKFKNKSNN